MTGISNVISGIEHLPAHIKAAIQAFEQSNPEIAPYVALLGNSIATLESQAKTVGLPVLQAGAKELATEVAGALTGSETKSAAGNAAIATVKATGSTLGDDVLHILTTDSLTEVAKVAAANSLTPTAAKTDAAKTVDPTLQPGVGGIADPATNAGLTGADLAPLTTGTAVDPSIVNTSATAANGSLV